MHYIDENLLNVKSNINKAIENLNRKPEDVTLIAVSKTKPLSDLEIAYAAGVRDFGENKVQELSLKYDAMPKDCRFHMIGHLQKNKVKDVVGKAFLIHGVDSFELAQKISDISVKKNIITDILLEVNVAMEESKFGLTKDNLLKTVKDISFLPNIKVKGLMTVAPYVDDPEENRQHFVELKRLAIDIDNQNIDNISMGILSMGMTGDYEVAIEEGATMVRVGTGIFGARDYSV